MADQQGTPPQSPDRAGFSQPFVELVERSQHIVNEWLSRNGLEDLRAATVGSFHIATLFIELTSQIMAIPATIVSAQMSLWQDYFAQWQSTTARMLMRELMPLTEVGEPLHDEAWQDVDIFGYVKQSYLLAARCITDMARECGASGTSTHETMDFYTRQFADALSAADFALDNPEVIRATIGTRGENLITGLKNLLTALEGVRHGCGARQDHRFVVGQTLATTPGKVIFRNELMELIQYQPTSTRVLKRPLLFVPAWLNKYYVLDLRPENSLVKWAVDQGHTVFMISWATPDDDTARKSFADYVLQGPVKAVDVIEQASGEAEINAVGYCLGGTLLASTLAYLAESGDERIRTGTFLTTMLDFSRPGELGALMDEATLCLLGDGDEHGPDARELAATSKIQRESDLIWSFVINNYLLGKDPFPFDLLHWNRDSPPIPLGIHSFYLHNLYRGNKLVERDGVAVANRRIDLRKVNIPIYVLGTREDHIAPWKSTYKSIQLFPGESRFTLAASGHLAGVINPPEANKYCYWTNTATPENPEDWRTGAKAIEGSWWRDWDTWIKDVSDAGQVPAREPGGRKMKSICDAPGEYVIARA